MTHDVTHDGDDRNWTLEGKWDQFKGKVKQQWGHLTNNDMDVIQGKRDELVGRVKERYGYTKDQAEREVDEWYDKNIRDRM